MTLRTSHLAAAIALAFALPLQAAETPAPKIGEVQVTATREAEAVVKVPASITVVTDEEMRARGVHDLTGALALVAGVEITPTGDGGPAGSVPALWGLREFDAFLLVIDGVPAGGAFNPQLTTLSLVNVERIEVMRGAAPVMYGATSFVGVIHIIHYAPGHTPSRYGISAGSRGSVRADVSSDIGNDALPQSIALEAEKVGLSDDDAGYRRGNLRYRLQHDFTGGNFSFDLNASTLRQQPNSPVPRTGPVLDPAIPLDANFNPSDAKLDEDRIELTGRIHRAFGFGDWDTTLSYARTKHDILRGFLAEDYAEDPPPPSNAEGFGQQRHVDDVYFDSHVVSTFQDGSTLTYGFDYMYGHARYENFLYEYSVGLDGSNRPALSGTEPVDEPAGADRRNFAGLYIQTDRHLSDTVDLLAGLRLNYTHETMDGEMDVEGGDPVPATDHRRENRLGGSLGLSWRVWSQGEDSLTLYGDVRNTFKPAALDFGPEAEADILEPETASSIEVGAKGHALQGRLDWDLSGFFMYFDNLVIAQAEGGLPGLENAGKETFKGAEFETSYALTDDLRFYGHYAWHDARFDDFVQDFDGVPTQLDGKRLELSPKQLGGIGLVYSPARGWQASLVADRVGSRFLNKRNTALAPAYSTVAASIGYRFESCELRLSGTNLGDRRDPVAESELGEGQYYRLPARTVELGVSCTR
jgi:iron complex outermembrane receptor protein